MATALACGQLDTLSGEDCDARIRAAKRRRGAGPVRPGYHYRRDEVFRHAHFSSDSLKLSRLPQISIVPDLAAG